MGEDADTVACVVANRVDEMNCLVVLLVVDVECWLCPVTSIIC